MSEPEKRPWCLGSTLFVVYGIAALLVATWIVGLFDALHHARDAWGIMPTALVLSVLAAVLAGVATSIGFASLRTGGAR